ncbi:sulfotransferase [Pseudomonas alliivorans]|nr:sulfotransferase [Pseudomonas alliivorans]
MQKFHFIAGLPRSGSTLLSAILLQNPRFHAGMSSPVGSLFSSILGQCSAGSEFSSVINTDMRRRLLRGIFDSYYADQSAKDVVFDTSRGWTSRLPALKDLFPQCRMIACVRNVAWVMDSIERLYRANPFENTRLFNDDVERNTVYSRVETLAQRNRLVGFAWASLKEAYYGEHAGSILLIDYDLLSQAPDRVMRLVYDFIDEPWFEHDFNNLSYDAPQFDDALGVSGLHKVKPRVALEPRATILPPDLFEQYSKLSFWNDGAASAANVIRMKSDAAVK